MCTPWWYTRYYPSDSNTSEDQFYDNNPAIDQHQGLFDRTNCFIDGSCITHGTIYKNNSTLQWVYTTVLVLMIVGWIPWLIFLHLLHSRVNKNRTPMKGRRLLMVITAVLTMAIILTAIIVFAAGMVKGNGIYNQGGLYGHLPVVNNGRYTGAGNTGLPVTTFSKRDVGPMAAMSLNKRTGSSGASGVSGPPGGSGGTGPILPPGVSFPSTSDGPSSSNGPSSSSQEASASATFVVPSTTIEVPSTVDTTTIVVVVPPVTLASSQSTETTFTDTSATATTSADTNPINSNTASDTTFATTTTTDGDNVNDGDNNVIGFIMDPSIGVLPPVIFGTLPFGGSRMNLLGAGIPILKNVNASSIVGDLDYKYGAHSAWYAALLALALIPLALIFGLCVAPTARVVSQAHGPVARSVVAAPVAVGVPAAFAAPAAPATVYPPVAVGNGVVHPPVSFPNPGAAVTHAPVSYGAPSIAAIAAPSTLIGAAAVGYSGSAQPAALRESTPLNRRVTQVYHESN